ncbi:MAG: hypothetical protein ACRDYE_07815, partial [Acidimicrobiales bacterium]
MHETNPSGRPTGSDGGDGGDRVMVTDPGGPSADGSPGEAPPDRASSRRWRGRPWRAVFFAPVGDGRTRRRGSDAVRLALAVLVVVLCWVVTRANSSAEQAVASTMASAPDGIRWVVSAIWWIASIGLIVITGVLALASRRWSVVRDIGLSGLGAWLLSVVLASVLGSSGGRPPSSSLAQFDAAFPVALVAATVGVAVAASPYLSRWLQLSLEVAIGLLAVATVVHGSGFPVAVLASLGAGWGTAALVRLIFGSPLGLPSTEEVGVLLGDLELAIEDIAPNPLQGWGVGRFFGRLGTSHIDVSVYGRDASDAQLLAKTARFIFYRDSGPTLVFTRRQQVEHEAYLTIMAERAGALVPEVLAAGPAGPARDALLVTRPPAGSPLAAFTPYTTPPDDDADGDHGGPGPSAHSPTDGGGNGRGPAADQSDRPVLAEDALDSVFGQLETLRRAGIAHGSLSTQTIVVDERQRAGFVDFRLASTGATIDQLNRDVAAVMAATATVAGPERTVAAVLRAMPAEALVAALPYLQRAALDTVASKSLRGKKAILTELREQGAVAVGVEVPKLLEPRRVSWVSLAMVAGTLIGGWALIGVLIDVTKSWSTIAGADWAWVALVFVLAQAAYPAIAVTTVGSVTDPLPYGRTVALEFSDTFVGLAGGSMAVLATRVRFFQQEGYTPTVAVSSGVLASTASWIVKGA